MMSMMSMTRPLIALVVLCAVSAAGSGCRAAAPLAEVAKEPPPPLVEPELAPGSRLVEPRADALVRAMAIASRGSRR